MPTDSTFTPAPPASDPLTFDQVLENNGTYGSGSDDPVCFVINGVAFDSQTELQFPAPADPATRFRPLHGTTTVTIES